MTIAVCIKAVPDTQAQINILEDKSDIQETDIKWVMNPYDEFALEEALKLKEETKGSVAVFCVGTKKTSSEILKTALALGADTVFLVEATHKIDSFPATKALGNAILKNCQSFDIILTGKISIDNGGESVSQMIAEFLKLPHVHGVNNIKYDQKILTQRKIEGDTETVEVASPCLISVTKGINTPRYPTLPNIMKAKSKPIHFLKLEDLQVAENDVKIEIKNYTIPKKRAEVKMIEGDEKEQAKTLVKLLREEARVL